MSTKESIGILPTQNNARRRFYSIPLFSKNHLIIIFDLKNSLRPLYFCLKKMWKENWGGLWKDISVGSEPLSWCFTTYLSRAIGRGTNSVKIVIFYKNPSGFYKSKSNKTTENIIKGYFYCNFKHLRFSPILCSRKTFKRTF